MAVVNYQISANKGYSYNNSILTDVPLSLSFNFTADVPDPVAADITPYYLVGSEEFNNIIEPLELKFLNSSISSFMGADRNEDYSTWTETYARVRDGSGREDSNIFDISMTVNMPSWKLRFFNFRNPGDANETRRLRQRYGYTPLSGSISLRSTKRIGSWRELFVFYDDKFLISNYSITESWNGDELLFNISMSWRSYDLTSLPIFKDRL